VDLGGTALQPVPAAVTARGVDNPGVPKLPQDLGKVIRRNPGLLGKIAPSMLAPSGNRAR